MKIPQQFCNAPAKKSADGTLTIFQPKDWLFRSRSSLKKAGNKEPELIDWNVHVSVVNNKNGELRLFHVTFEHPVITTSKPLKKNQTENNRDKEKLRFEYNASDKKYEEKQHDDTNMSKYYDVKDLEEEMRLCRFIAEDIRDYFIKIADMQIAEAKTEDQELDLYQIVKKINKGDCRYFYTNSNIKTYEEIQNAIKEQIQKKTAAKLANSKTEVAKKESKEEEIKQAEKTETASEISPKLEKYKKQKMDTKDTAIDNAKSLTPESVSPVKPIKKPMIKFNLNLKSFNSSIQSEQPLKDNSMEQPSTAQKDDSKITFKKGS